MGLVGGSPSQRLTVGYGVFCLQGAQLGVSPMLPVPNAEGPWFALACGPGKHSGQREREKRSLAEQHEGG